MALTLEEKKEILEELKKELKSNIYDIKKIYVETCRENVILPTYKHEGDAGMDIYSAEEMQINPGETKIVPTGLKMAIPNGYELQVRPRSGISLNTPLRIANTPGTIDSGYRDEIGIIITNTSFVESHNINFNNLQQYNISEKGNKNGSYKILKNDRIAQIVLCKHEIIEFVPVKSGSVQNLGTNRGGGFGHSGTR